MTDPTTDERVVFHVGRNIHSSVCWELITALQTERNELQALVEELEGENVDFIKWHQDNGGFAGNLGGHACRLLRETVELCVAAGASMQDIDKATEAEIGKATERFEFGGNPDNLPQEFADVSILQEVFAYYAGIDVAKSRKDKYEILLGREWEPDTDGVLWRPGTASSLARGEAERERRS